MFEQRWAKAKAIRGVTTCTEISWYKYKWYRPDEYSSFSSILIGRKIPPLLVQGFSSILSWVLKNDNCKKPEKVEEWSWKGIEGQNCAAGISEGPETATISLSQPIFCFSGSGETRNSSGWDWVRGAYNCSEEKQPKWQQSLYETLRYRDSSKLFHYFVLVTPTLCLDMSDKRNTVWYKQLLYGRDSGCC